MKNLNKRIASSFPLVLVVYFSFISSVVLFIFLFLISLISLIEINNILKKLFIKKITHTFFFLLSTAYISFFSIEIFLLLNSDDYGGKILLLFLLLICISTDLGGYIFGKLFKGKKLTNISPNKTYSGLFGSYILSIITFLLFYKIYDFSLDFLILTIIISSISQIGDLFFSYLKRCAKIKDMGKILPGHGGILDRIDGIIFAIPIGINILIFF